MALEMACLVLGCLVGGTVNFPSWIFCITLSIVERDNVTFTSSDMGSSSLRVAWRPCTWTCPATGHDATRCAILVLGSKFWYVPVQPATKLA